MDEWMNEYELPTDGRDDGGREKEGAGELPLFSGLVRHELDDVRRDVEEVFVGDVVALPEEHLLLTEFLLFSHLVVRLESIEYGCSDE